MRANCHVLVSFVLHLHLSAILLPCAELHHQRPLPRPTTAVDTAEAISLHANASRANFAVGDHVISWLAEHLSQHQTRRHVPELTAEDVVFIVMVTSVALHVMHTHVLLMLTVFEPAGKHSPEKTNQGTESILDALG